MKRSRRTQQVSRELSPDELVQLLGLWAEHGSLKEWLAHTAGLRSLMHDGQRMGAEILGLIGRPPFMLPPHAGIQSL